MPAYAFIVPLGTQRYQAAIPLGAKHKDAIPLGSTHECTKKYAMRCKHFAKVQCSPDYLSINIIEIPLY